jgi:pyrroloquinoline quinone biosynthesis protein D
MVKLNGGAGEVLKLVDGKNSVSSIIDELEKKFPDTPTLENDIVGMIEMALEKVWVEKVN